MGDKLADRFATAVTWMFNMTEMKQAMACPCTSQGLCTEDTKRAALEHETIQLGASANLQAYK